MTRARVYGLLAVYAIIALWSVRAQAAHEGQADLDKATELQVTAQSLSDLEKVTSLCESALKKGLDEENGKFAKQLLTSTLYQHAKQLSAPIFDQSPPDRRWALLRQFALQDLDKIVEIDPTLADAQLLMARLHALPGGDRERGTKAASAAVKLFENDKKQKAAALVIRGQLREKAEERLKDYAQAIEADPGNVDAWQGRALTYLDEGQVDKAIEDLNALLKENADNVNAHLALAEALTNLEKYDEAMQHVERALKLKPDSSLGHTLRARLYVLKEDIKAAMADLDQALKLQPSDLSALLIRARLRLSEKDITGAKDDVERALLLSPDLSQAILIRSLISAEEGRLGDAIADVQTLLKEDPKNVTWRMHLAGCYIQDRRPSKAIAIFTEIMAEEKDNSEARQARADTLLSVGKHQEAIADFEVLFKEKPDSDSILNNLAWVLATSPDDKLRDGKRAIELATKACELTKYEKAHILSTLASAYAETGDFETAIKWSSKAVELGAKSKEVDEQLKKELESYQQKKPWRERQMVEEKEDPVQPPQSKLEV